MQNHIIFIISFLTIIIEVLCAYFLYRRFAWLDQPNFSSLYNIVFAFGLQTLLPLSFIFQVFIQGSQYQNIMFYLVVIPGGIGAIVPPTILVWELNQHLNGYIPDRISHIFIFVMGSILTTSIFGTKIYWDTENEFWLINREPLLANVILFIGGIWLFIELSNIIWKSSINSSPRFRFAINLYTMGYFISYIIILYDFINPLIPSLYLVPIIFGHIALFTSIKYAPLLFLIPQEKFLPTEFIKEEVINSKYPKVIIDKQYKILFVNTKFYELYNVPLIECFGKHIDDIISETHEVISSFHLLSSFSYQSTIEWMEEHTWKGELQKELHDGEIIEVREYINPINYGGQINFFSIKSEKITREERIREEREKTNLKETTLEVYSLLAGGVVHDYNNYLMVLQGNIDYLVKLTSDSSNQNKINSIFKTLTKTVQEAASLTTSLRTISNRENDNIVLFDLIPIVKQTSKLFTSGKGVILDINTELTHAYVRGNRTKLSRVISNLIVNATEAMKDVDRGRIEITISKQDHNYLKHVRIEVRDFGSGIHPDIESYIFSSYFSTKQRGSGLGLSTSKEIIDSMEGDLVLDWTDPSRGSKFSIWLPLKSKKVLSSSESSKIHEYDLKGTVILIMDDDEKIVQTLKLNLSQRGASVITAKHGDEVKEIMKNISIDDLDIALIDLTNKLGPGGYSSIKLINEYYPNAVNIMMSGYADPTVKKIDERPNFDYYLNKPFTFNELMKILTDINKRGKFDG